MGVRPDGCGFDWLPIFWFLKKWLIKFILVGQGVINKLEIENKNGKKSRKKNRGLVEKVISWILIYRAYILLLKWADLSNLSKSAMPKELRAG